MKRTILFAAAMLAFVAVVDAQTVEMNMSQMRKLIMAEGAITSL